MAMAAALPSLKALALAALMSLINFLSCSVEGLLSGLQLDKKAEAAIKNKDVSCFMRTQFFVKDEKLFLNFFRNGYFCGLILTP